MKQIGVKFLIDDIDFTDYVTSIERTHNLCDPIAGLTVQLAPNFPCPIETYKKVTLSEGGIRTFTGYTQNIEIGRFPVDISLECKDVLIRTLDTWITGPHVANGEAVVAWIAKFLKLAGITAVTNCTYECYSIFPGYEWSYMTTMEAITSCLQMAPYQIFATRHGGVVIMQLPRKGIVDNTISSCIDYERTVSDSWIRNRAIVYGSGFVVDVSENNSHLIPGEVRAAIVATGQIYNYSTASSLASRMLAEFRNPLDIKVLNVEGGPGYNIGQLITVNESFTGYSENCLITGVKTKLSSEGYVTELTFDEKCPTFWGWDSPPTTCTTIYAGTGGAGVYSACHIDYAGINWSTLNAGLSGSALNVFDIKVADDGVQWIATNGGLYKRIDADWIKLTLPEPDTGLGEPNVCTVLTSIYDTSVYVLAHLLTEEKIWVYRTQDNGLTWTIYSGDEGNVREEYASYTANYYGRKFCITGNILRAHVAIRSAGTRMVRRDSTGYWGMTEGSPWDSSGTSICNGHLYPTACNAGTSQAAANLQGGSWSVWANSNFRDYYDCTKSHNTNFVAFLKRKQTEGTWHSTIVDLDETDGGDYDNLLHSLPDDTFIPEHFYRWGNIYYVSIASKGVYNTNTSSYETTQTASAPFVFFNSTLWMATGGKKLWYRNSTGGWTEDAVECDDNINCVYERDGSLYIGTDTGLWKRSSSYSKIITASNIRQLVYYDKAWFAWCDGVADVRGIWRLTRGGPMKVPTEGQTHLLDEDINYLYVAVLRLLGTPVLVRITKASGHAEVVHSMAGGDWEGVRLDFSGRVWVFGNYGSTTKIAYSDDYGQLFEDITNPAWGAAEKVRSYIPLIFGRYDGLAVLNTEKSIWALSGEDTWTKLSDIEFSTNFGNAELEGYGIFLGRNTGNASILQLSINDGISWAECSSGLSKTYKIANVCGAITNV